MRSPRSRLVIATLLASMGAVSCAAILGFERLSTEDGFVIPDSSTETAPTEEASIQVEAGPDANPCNDLGLPPEPSDADGGGPPVIVAVRLLDFGVDNDAGIISIPGFNLDRACSTELASTTCTTNVLEATFDRHAKDKTATGVDNAGISLIQYITRLPTDLLTADNINAGIADGRYGATVRISDWNGTPNDSDVFVEIFPAIGLTPRADPDAGFGPDDEWVLDRRFQVSTFSSSTVKSDHAYVSNGKLAARFSSVFLPIKLDRDPKPFDIHITDAVLAGTLAGADGGTTLSGASVAGRWKTSEFLGQVRTIYIKNANGVVDKVLCDPDPESGDRGHLLYLLVKSEICNARDIRSDSKDGQQLGCDALSAAMRVESYPVTSIGVFDAGPTIPDRCTDPGTLIADGDDCTAN